MATKLFKLNPNSAHTHPYEGKRYGYDVRVCRTDEEEQEAKKAGFEPGLLNVIKTKAEAKKPGPKPKKPGPKPKKPGPKPKKPGPKPAEVDGNDDA